MREVVIKRSARHWKSLKNYCYNATCMEMTDLFIVFSLLVDGGYTKVFLFCF